jgi:hypothetical protein
MRVAFVGIRIESEDGTVDFPFQNGEVVAEISGRHENHKRDALYLLQLYPGIATHPIIEAAGGMDISYLDAQRGPLTHAQMAGRHNFNKLIHIINKMYQLQ